MNLSELVAQVQENIGRDDKADKIPSYINLALRRIGNEYPRFREWQRTSHATVETDTRIINLPDRYSTIYSVQFVDSDEGPLTRITRRDYDDKYTEVYTDNYTTGIPRVYAVWGGNLEFYPVPNEELRYILRWSIQPSELTEDDDEPMIPHDNCIIELATVIAYNRLGLPEEATQHYQVYQSYLNAAINNANTTAQDRNLKLEPYQTSTENEIKSKVQRGEFV